MESSSRLRVRCQSSPFVHTWDWAVVSFSAELSYLFSCQYTFVSFPVFWVFFALKKNAVWTFWTCVPVYMGNFFKEIYSVACHSICTSSSLLGKAKLFPKEFVLLFTPAVVYKTCCCTVLQHSVLCGFWWIKQFLASQFGTWQESWINATL